MLSVLRHRLREITLRRALRLTRRKIVVIASLGLPEDLERAAMRKMERLLEERLDEYTQLD